MKSAALGFRAHSGWTALVALSVYQGCALRFGAATNSPGGNFHLSFSAALPYREEIAARRSTRLCRRRPDASAKPRPSRDPRTPGKSARGGLPAHALRSRSRVGKAAARPARYSGVTCADSHRRWRTLSRSASPRLRPLRSFEQGREGTRTPRRGIARFASRAGHTLAPHRRSRPSPRRAMVAGRETRVADCLARARIEAIASSPPAPRYLKLRDFLCFL